MTDYNIDKDNIDIDVSAATPDTDEQNVDKNTGKTHQNETYVDSNSGVSVNILITPTAQIFRSTVPIT